MEIRISSKQMLKVLHILSWIIFVGLLVDAGAYTCNALFMLTANPFGPHYFWNGADFSNLYQLDRGYFCVIMLLMIIVAVMKALMFYSIIKLFLDKKLDMDYPFNREVGRFIFKLSYAALAIGIFSSWAINYFEWFVKKGITMPDVKSMNAGGADVWLFMAVILFVIGHIFKRGIEIQAENELTV